ncbi:MAG: hypothetical protein ACRC2T_13880, partial [Thermoguttaceae bacterium]
MEKELIEKIRRKTAPRAPASPDNVSLCHEISAASLNNPQILLGIGDDAALLAPVLFPNTGTVLTVDLLTEGVDFLLEKTD